LLHFTLVIKQKYIYFFLMRHSTPFFTAFGPLLFGRPPVSGMAEALAKFSQCTTLSHLRKLFGAAVPAALLAPRRRGQNSRQRLFSLEVVFWTFLDQVQTPGGSCREAVRKVMALARRKFLRHDDEAMSPHTSAYCQARARLPLKVLDDIQHHLAGRLHNHIPHGARWHNLHVRVVDGTSLSMPDTDANQARWPQSKSQKPGCGFPVMNLVGIFCLHSGALMEAAYGERKTHETRLFRQLWDTFEPGDLALADRGFCSYAAVAGLLAREVDSLMRLPEKKIRVAIGSQLPKEPNFDVTVTWQRPAQCPPGAPREEFALLPESIRIRVIRYTVSKPGFRTQSVTLVTTLLNADIPSSDLAELYFQRWGVELRFREIKTHLNMDILRCKSPHMIERELRMHFIAYNLVRSLMQKAALNHDVELARVSFKGSLDTLRQFANAASGAENKPRTVAALVDEMLLAIARDLVPLRPDRLEPRVRKRRPKNYRLLTKPRKEMGPLPHRKIGRENHPKTSLS
jgi:hypothetical protein